ncbi:hypothetical protein DOTSEDRAFT_33450 [Dothistroma septosporum NZE10]|uniref:Uncharacterized protein n=1 Tax=Dothistroma septosporum (strain NZE10 / CBS 128990) TaxID=675120 RepID=N1PWZ4_DOTSN|nr:hypothetical protein DOTSEDRAFT_33450 [Dothistroma septosporum NZE10]
MSRRNAGNSTDDSYDLRRRRREEARVHARELARDQSWEEVYTANTETDETEDDEMNPSGTVESAPCIRDEHSDLLPKAIIMGHGLARSLPSSQAQQQSQEELDATGEHREFDELARRRWRGRLEARTTSPSMFNDESSGGESGESEFEHEATTTTFNRPTTVPCVQRHDSSDSEQSTALSDSRYDPQSDSDTSTYDRELYGLPRANLNFEGSQVFGDRYIRHNGRLSVPRRTQSTASPRAARYRRTQSVCRPSYLIHQAEGAAPSRAATTDHDLVSTQFWIVPSLLEVTFRLGLPQTRAIRLLDHAHHSSELSRPRWRYRSQTLSDQSLQPSTFSCSSSSPPWIDPLMLSDFLLNNPGENEELRNDLARFVVVYHQYPDLVRSGGFWEPLAVHGINIDEVIALLEELSEPRYNGEALRADDVLAGDGTAEGQVIEAEVRNCALAVGFFGEDLQSSPPRLSQRERISEQRLHRLARTLQDAHQRGALDSSGARMKARHRMAPDMPFDAFVMLARSVHPTRSSLSRWMRERLSEAGIEFDGVREILERCSEDERAEMGIGYHG